MAIAGCAGHRAEDTIDEPSTRILVRGSNTMQPLVRRWAVEYMRENPGVSIYTEGGGSRRGIEALIAGEIDICCASRTLSPDEVRRLAQRHGGLGVRYLTAKDAIGIFVHPDNPLRALTREQVTGILTGRIRDWSEVGIGEGSIQVYVREPNSGTRGFVQEHVLAGASFPPDATVCVGIHALLRCVAADPLGITFGGLTPATGVRACEIDGVAPTPENVADGRYPIARYLYLYTIGTPTPHVQRFIDYVEGDEGQAVVAEVGFVPLWP
jgi:phosphate transport system substrate-binding protein